jgi:hypothetical protein
MSDPGAGAIPQQHAPEPSAWTSVSPPVRHSYGLTVRDHGLMTAFGLLIRTMPYAFARFGILLAYSVACIIWIRGVHLTGVQRRLGQWNVPTPAPTTLSPLGSFRLGSRLMQTAWNGCDGLTASSARSVVIREDGGLGTAGSCALDAVAAHR